MQYTHTRVFSRPQPRKSTELGWFGRCLQRPMEVEIDEVLGGGGNKIVDTLFDVSTSNDEEEYDGSGTLDGVSILFLCETVLSYAAGRGMSKDMVELST